MLKQANESNTKANCKNAAGRASDCHTVLRRMVPHSGSTPSTTDMTVANTNAN